MNEEKKISELDPAYQVSDTDALPVVQGASTLKLLMSSVSSYINDRLPQLLKSYATTGNANTASKLNSVRSISINGDASWSVPFDGSGDASNPLTLSDTGVTAATYARVTVDAKGRVTNGATVLPVVAGGTGSNSPSGALAQLGAAPIASPTFTGTPTGPTAAVGTNTSQLATSAQIQNEFSNKRAWTSYTPTITPLSGSFTAASAAGRYLVIFGICYVQIALSVTTRGSGAFPTLSLPFAALGGSADHLLPCRESKANLKLGQAKINAALTGVQLTAYDSTDFTADGATLLVNGSYPIA